MIKRSLTIFVLALFAVTSAFATKFDNMQEGEYYKVFVQGEISEYEEIIEKLDASFNLYNNFFRFHPEAGPANKFIVKIFNTEESFKSYISKYEMNTSSSFLFIQFSNQALNELVGYKTGLVNFDETLLHYSCIQYIRSVIQRPPLWLEKGVAVYFEKSEFDSQRGEYIYKENLAWLQTLKNTINSEKKLIPMPTLLQADNKVVQENSELFYAQSWSLVSFLLNYPSAEYNRVIWNTIGGLEKAGTSDENNMKTVEAFNWINKNKFQSDYFNYINGLRTFPELINDGIEMYRNGKYDEAEGLFVDSLKMKDDNFIPYYYLGLINYNKNDFAMAEFYFNSALQMNGDEGLCYYALAINAYASGNLEDALDYLEITLEKDESFRAKVEKLQKTINTEKTFSTQVEVEATEEAPTTETAPEPEPTDQQDDQVEE
ncbi:MAG: DUF1570 domain-containing protein [Spirochaetales bacterium]|nr:DUF1570 domain-containing protein [Spirochaetales bacterium]